MQRKCIINLYYSIRIYENMCKGRKQKGKHVKGANSIRQQMTKKEGNR